MAKAGNAEDISSRSQGDDDDQEDLSRTDFMTPSFLQNRYPILKNTACILLETNFGGDLVIELNGNEALVRNFIRLCQIRFYTNTLAFQVTAGRFAQFGCPVGDGTGGACIHGILDAYKNNYSYKKSPKRFLKSTESLPSAMRHEKGIVIATCQGGIPDTIGSQFLITTDSGPDKALDGYIDSNIKTENDEPLLCPLGVVVEDDNNVLDRINTSYTDEKGRPFADIRITRALVVFNPFEGEDDKEMTEALTEYMVNDKKIKFDPLNRVIDSPSPERPDEETVPIRPSAADLLETEKEHAYDSSDEENDERKKELERLEQERAAQAETQSRAVVLEMLGDLPDANIRAPENVLFICKLNPITQDDDLELIFSRFDEKVKVDVIRDYETGQSLQYAFAEFTTEKQAAEAYLKMNQALIDDRRIHVDFSQSVSTLWDKYHQRMRRPPNERERMPHIADAKGNEPSRFDSRRGGRGGGRGRGNNGNGGGRGGGRGIRNDNRRDPGERGRGYGDDRRQNRDSGEKERDGRERHSEHQHVGRIHSDDNQRRDQVEYDDFGRIRRRSPRPDRGDQHTHRKRRGEDGDEGKEYPPRRHLDSDERHSSRGFRHERHHEPSRSRDERSDEKDSDDDASHSSYSSSDRSRGHRRRHRKSSHKKNRKKKQKKHHRKSRHRERERSRSRRSRSRSPNDRDHRSVERDEDHSRGRHRGDEDRSSQDNHRHRNHNDRDDGSVGSRDNSRHRRRRSYSDAERFERAKGDESPYEKRSDDIKDRRHRSRDDRKSRDHKRRYDSDDDRGSIRNDSLHHSRRKHSRNDDYDDEDRHHRNRDDSDRQHRKRYRRSRS